MKFFVAVALIAFVAVAQSATLTDEQKAKAAKYFAECREQFKVTDEEVAQYKAGNISGATDEAKCLANCFLEKAGIVKNGALEETAILQKFTPNLGEEKTKQLIETCRNEGGANNCEKSFNLYSCFKNNKAILAE